MYRLVWSGPDGSQQHQDYTILEDAVYAGLRQRHFSDGVEIVDPVTGVPVEM